MSVARARLSKYAAAAWRGSKQKQLRWLCRQVYAPNAGYKQIEMRVSVERGESRAWTKRRPRLSVHGDICSKVGKGGKAGRSTPWKSKAIKVAVYWRDDGSRHSRSCVLCNAQDWQLSWKLDKTKPKPPFTRQYPAKKGGRRNAVQGWRCEGPVEAVARCAPAGIRPGTATCVQCIQITCARPAAVVMATARRRPPLQTWELCEGTVCGVVRCGIQNKDKKTPSCMRARVCASLLPLHYHISCHPQTGAGRKPTHALHSYTEYTCAFVGLASFIPTFTVPFAWGTRQMCKFDLLSSPMVYTRVYHRTFGVTSAPYSVKFHPAIPMNHTAPQRTGAHLASTNANKLFISDMRSMPSVVGGSMRETMLYIVNIVLCKLSSKASIYSANLAGQSWYRKGLAKGLATRASTRACAVIHGTRHGLEK